MTVLFGVFLLTLLVITAVAIVRTQNLFVAVMLLGIFSLLIAANFFILDAADVALTEAAVGAGISTVLFLGANGQIGRLGGALLFTAGVIYTVYTIRASQRGGEAELDDEPRSRVGLTRAVLLTALGMVLLVVGARWMVEAATVFARAFGVSDLVVGLTVVAVGTTLPEAAASVMAALRGQRDMAVGNAIGSNIFNIVNVLGLTALLAPAGVPVPEPALWFDLPVMIAVAVACLPIFFVGHRIARWEGAVFLSYYALYILYLVLQAEHHAALPAFNRAMMIFVIPLTVATFGVIVWREIRRRRAA